MTETRVYLLILTVCVLQYQYDGDTSLFVDSDCLCVCSTSMTETRVYLLILTVCVLQYQYDGDTSLFEDDDTRQFYETLPDLKAIIPGVSITTPLSLSYLSSSVLKWFCPVPSYVSQFCSVLEI